MTETSKKPHAQSSSKKSETTAKSETTVTSKTSTESGKSSKESIGGASSVHYGFFSNIKTPEYRSGWDDIWSKNKKAKKTRSVKGRQPKTVSIKFNELPTAVQQGLIDAAKSELKNSRINYSNRVKRNKISWQIKCNVEN